jgi:hypothetical protein
MVSVVMPQVHLRAAGSECSGVQHIFFAERASAPTSDHPVLL